MYTEIILQTRKPLPANLKSSLEVYFSPSADIKAVLDETIFKQSYELIPRIVYAYSSYDKIFLVFNNDSNTLGIHVEHSDHKSRVDLLMKGVNDTVRQFQKFLKTVDMSLLSVELFLKSEDCQLIKGVHTTRRNKFIELLKGDVFLKIYIPLVALSVSYWMDHDVKKAFVNALISVGATFVWLIWQTFTLKKGLKYSSII